ncbi:MAG: sulfatase-like hydrolase/transferase [Planctomycetota bacterium]
MADRPNVVVFFSDQQRWDTTGLNGCPLELTPNFDYWGSRGTVFPYATTPQPVCGPARACLQTGKYATAVGDGCHTNGRLLPADHDSFAKRFADAGYTTGYFGKWHLGRNEHDENQAVIAEDRGGWDHWLAAQALEACSDGYHTILYDKDNRETKLPGYRVDAVADAGIRFIGEQAPTGEPFCMMISEIEPHMQNHRDAHPAPAGYEERYRGRWTPPDLQTLPGVPGFYEHLTGGNAQQALPGYLGSIKRLDEAFGRVMDALISYGIADNTIVVYTSDHGCHFRTRNDEYKRSCHDVSIRVPCMIHGGPFTGGGRDERPFQLTDLVPTLCDAAGVNAPEGAHGKSALGDLPDEAFVQISESHFGRAVRTNRWKYAAIAPNAKASDRHANDLVESHLYDLVADPYELVNLAGQPDYAEVRADMKQRLIRRMEQAGEPTPTIADTHRPKHEIGQQVQRETRPSDDLHPLTS